MSTMVDELALDVASSNYTCEHCNETFVKRKSLKKHVRKAHTKLHLQMLEEKSKNPGGYACKYCDHAFRKEKTLNIHMREDHEESDELNNIEKGNYSEEGVEVEISSSDGEEEKHEEDISSMEGNVDENEAKLADEQCDGSSDGEIETGEEGKKEDISCIEGNVEINKEDGETLVKLAAEEFDGNSNEGTENISLEHGEVDVENYQSGRLDEEPEHIDTIHKVDSDQEEGVLENPDHLCETDANLEQCLKEGGTPLSNLEKEEIDDENSVKQNEQQDSEDEVQEEVDIANEDGNSLDDSSLGEDLSQFLEVDIADSSSDEINVDGSEEMDSSAEINISGEAVIELVEDDEFDEIAEEVKKVKTTSRLLRKRSHGKMAVPDEDSAVRKSKRMDTDFDGEITIEDVEEIKELPEVALISSGRGRRSLDYKFPNYLPECSEDTIMDMIKNSDFFKSKKSLIKPYTPNHKSYDIVDDDLPSGFKVWEQVRPNGKHVDKEFLTPNGLHVLRSKLAVMEYCNMLLGTQVEIQEEKKKSTLVTKKNTFITNKGLNVFKEKLKKSLGKVPEKKIQEKSVEDDEISIVKSLPKGTKVKFTFVPDSPDTSTTAKKYSCSLCKKIFLTRTGFDTHVTKDHKNARPVKQVTESPSAVKKLICSYCKQVFPSRPQFMQHMAEDHTEVTSAKNTTTITPPAGSTRRGVSRPPSTKFSCNCCNKKFDDESLLEEHKKIHFIKCLNCTEVFTSKSKLAEHRRAEHYFKCMKCNETFEAKKTLEEHLVVEHYFKCEECELVLDGRKNLEAHNEEEHTFRCGECPEIFSAEDHCSVHVKTVHQSCATCEDEFSWAEPDHKCYYTRNGVSPPTERVVEQNLYQGYFF